MLNGVSKMKYLLVLAISSFSMSVFSAAEDLAGYYQGKTPGFLGSSQENCTVLVKIVTTPNQEEDLFDCQVEVQSAKYYEAEQPIFSSFNCNNLSNADEERNSDNGNLVIKDFKLSKVVVRGNGRLFEHVIKCQDLKKKK